MKAEDSLYIRIMCGVDAKSEKKLHCSLNMEGSFLKLVKIEKCVLSVALSSDPVNCSVVSCNTPVVCPFPHPDPIFNFFGSFCDIHSM